MLTSLSISFKMDSLGNSQPSNGSSSNNESPPPPQDVDHLDLLDQEEPSSPSPIESTEVIVRSHRTFLGFNSSQEEGLCLPKDDETQSIGFLDLGTSYDGYIS